MVGISYEDSTLVGYSKEVDPYSPWKADIWAMGMLLIYMLMIPNMHELIDFWQDSGDWGDASDIKTKLSGDIYFKKSSKDMIELLSEVLCKDPVERLGAGSFLMRFQKTPEYLKAVGSSNR